MIWTYDYKSWTFCNSGDDFLYLSGESWDGALQWTLYVDAVDKFFEIWVDNDEPPLEQASKMVRDLSKA